MSMKFIIEEATIEQAKAKIAIVGPAGAGKTYTALVTAQELGKSILVIDTENKSSTKYANQFKFHVLGLPDHSLKTYIEALEYAADQGYDVVIIDSLSHAWAGKGGALEQVETASKAKYGGNHFAGWADVTPLQNKLIDTILNYNAHIVATMRTKIEYALVTDSKGRQKPQKLGLGVIQRDNFEYEFDIIAQMDVEHNMIVTKTRCFTLDGFMCNKPDGEFGQAVAEWLNDGEYIPSFTSLDDLLYQLSKDFGLSESVAKQALKDRNFTTWPQDKNAQLQRSREMYKAVKMDLAAIKSKPKKQSKATKALMDSLDQTVLDPMLDQEGLTEAEKEADEIDEYFPRQETLVDVPEQVEPVTYE